MHLGIGPDTVAMISAWVIIFVRQLDQQAADRVRLAICHPMLATGKPDMCYDGSYSQPPPARSRCQPLPQTGASAPSPEV